MPLEVSEKWGFGMAPPKSLAQRERTMACADLLSLLKSETPPKNPKKILSDLSIAKGLFNRVVREDQWDWFTVTGQLGYPSRHLARLIASEISHLTTALRDGDEPAFLLARTNLLRLPVRRCLSVFLGLTQIVDEPGAGWVYILSTREIRDLLKIGMTARTVEARVQEINAATGVAIPFGVRRCWRVLSTTRAEKAVHTALSEYRIRDDREFFRVDFLLAADIVQRAITKAGLEIRTLNALAALDVSN